MCLGIAMKVVEIYDGGLNGVVETGGVKKHCFFHLIDDLKVGDYVIVHAGCAIEKIDEKDAMENMKLIEQCLLGDEVESDEP
ncbi:HypC/HybG/HupF family hydrogenase formation chaperone [Hippea jasoniae]|uniref:HypC/HybG/HupF family hydrogenase formation chaperone n=1 Tax=Hippea jasoniae TaxID=944479 RepID=UPI00055697D8|nr:HypC/HybG/HupF family hydrogenase formation chaperone [Hippea jasoniae]